MELSTGMNLTRIFLAALAGTVTYFLFGGILMGAMGGRLKDLYRPHAEVFRGEDKIMKYFPVGIATMFLCIAVAATFFAQIHPFGADWTAGGKFGVAMGAFVVFGHVSHNFVTLNIGPKLAVTMAGLHFVQWVLVCVAIALVYRP